MRFLTWLHADEKRVEMVSHNSIAGVLTSSSKACLVSESGVFKLIMRSKKPEARRFQNWVTREVLPAIRKDGAYVAGQQRRTGTGRGSPQDARYAAVNTNP